MSPDEALSINRFARLPRPAASGTTTSAPLAPSPAGHYSPTLPTHPGHWPQSFSCSRSSSSYRYASWSISIWTIILRRGYFLLYCSSSYSICWLRARIGERQTFFAGQYGHRQGPIQKLQRGRLPLAQDAPFFTVAPQKGKDAAPKGGNKGKNKGKDKGGNKGKGKGKGKDRKGWPHQIATI